MSKKLEINFITINDEILFTRSAEFIPNIGDVIETPDSDRYKVVDRVWYYDNLSYSNPTIDIILHDGY